MKYLDKFAAWLTPKLKAWNNLIAGGYYWTLPFGNDGRGTRVYAHVFVNFALIVVVLLVVGYVRG